MIFMTVINDQSTETDVYPFSTEQAAIDFARSYIADATDESCTEKVAPSADFPHIVWLATWGEEGEHALVIARPLDG